MITGMPAAAIATFPATLPPECDGPTAADPGRAAAGGCGFEQPAGTTTQAPSAHRTAGIDRRVR